MKTSSLNSRDHTIREALGGCKFMQLDRRMGVFTFSGRDIQHVAVMKHGSWKTYAAILLTSSPSD